MIMMNFIPWAQPNFWGKEKDYALDALESLWISGGAYIEKLEHAFAEILQKPYVLTTSNGTTALHLAYLGLGLQPGDEIIVPGFAFMGAANIALHLGVKPVFAEVDPETWCLTVRNVEQRITPRTKAIVPIHTYGNVCAMDGILELAHRKHLAVIEDCAEALFSKYANRYCGTFGQVNTFSFQATKTITTGEGGLVVTDDEVLYKKMTLYRSHGLLERGRYWHEVPGHNFRLTNIQAALGYAQVEQKETIITERKRVHLQYKACLEDVDGIRLQYFPEKVEPVLWAIALKLDQKAFPQGRDHVMAQLKEQDIETRPGFIASSLLTIYEPHRLRVSEEISQHVISLPTFPTLTNEHIQGICHCLKTLRR
jgi:perosamine synthetase